MRPRGPIAFLPQQKPRRRAPRRRSKWYGDERRRCLESRTEGLQRSCLPHARRSVKRRRLRDDRASCRRRTAEPNRGSRISGARTRMCLSNGEAERPADAARSAPRAHTVFQRPRRTTTYASRPAPAIVRGQPHGVSRRYQASCGSSFGTELSSGRRGA